jgi:hypothetical protein
MNHRNASIEDKSTGQEGASSFPAGAFYDIVFGKFQTGQSGNPTEKKLRPSLETSGTAPGRDGGRQSESGSTEQLMWFLQTDLEGPIVTVIQEQLLSPSGLTGTILADHISCKRE